MGREEAAYSVFRLCVVNVRESKAGKDVRDHPVQYRLNCFGSLSPLQSSGRRKLITCPKQLSDVTSASLWLLSTHPRLELP